MKSKIPNCPPLFEKTLHVGRPNIGDQEAFIKRVRDILDRQWLTNNGECVQELEKLLCRRLDVKHCIPVCNGTVGLEVAIRALGLTGEVILPSFTFIATAHALQWLGLKPIFCDIDPETLTLDPAAVERLITPETSAILGVHVYGRPCDVETLQEVADRNNLKLFFDAAHAFDCSHKGSMVGNFGQCEVFSFHATKIFNTFEGGAISTNDDKLAACIRKMINFGFEGMDNVTQLGINGKMNEICAAMGVVNLDALDDVVEINRRNFKAYREGFQSISGLKLIEPPEGEMHNYQYVVVQLGNDYPLSRDQLLERLHAENIRARRYFWPGCHEMEPYVSKGRSWDLPMTEKQAKQVLAFPTGTAVGVSDIDHVIGLCRV